MRIEYPADVKVLQPGHTYKLIVEAQTPSSTSPGEAIFTMLSEAEIQKVQETVGKIDGLNLPVEEKVLRDLYSIYTNENNNLIAEIIERLETLVREGSQTPKVYRILGDIYLQQGLLDFAKRRYEKAVELATNIKDTEELTAAQDRLTQINAELEKLK
jgi:tetratricopeptide (TPR) repeat protein